MIDRLILYGAGKRCKALYRVLRLSGVEIVAIIDSDSKKWGTRIEGILVKDPNAIRKLQNVNLCITIADYRVKNEVRTLLQEEYGYNVAEKEIHYDELILQSYKENGKIRQYISEKSVPINSETSVLFDCYRGLILGGVEAWTMDLCGALIENGNDHIYIISDNGNYKIPPVLTDHIVNVDIDHTERFWESSVLNLIDAIIEKLPCKVVTCTTDEVMLAAYLVKMIYPNMVEIISVIHNSNDSVYESCMDFSECPDIFIGVSHDIKNDMIQRGIVPESVYSMTCPFQCEKVLDRTYTKDNSLPLHIGYAGRMDGMEHSQKRMDLILKLIEMLVDKNVDFRMELAGDGAARKQMEEYISAHKWNEKVKFLGNLGRSEIPSFWRKQDICINLADYEGRCISKLEAMANGAVPIITNTAGAAEDVVDGVNGYIVPVGDYVLAADKVEFLEKNRGCLAKMGKRAHEKVYPKSLMKPHMEFWEALL